MNSYLKNYTIELTTLAPVFIGSGEQLGKKEYIYDKYEKKAWIFDRKTLYKHILEENLSDAYESYMLGKNGDLYVWMKENNISKSKYSTWAKYCLDCSYTELSERNRDISLFVKDPYGLPYIPGSSLKGAIRTALLGYEFSMNPPAGQLQSDIKYNSRAARKRNELSSKLRRPSQILEETFHTLKREKVKKENAVCDELSGLRISDSRSLNVHDLILCQKIDKGIDGSEQILPTFRECLKPQVKICFDMTIDESICNYKGKDILEAVSYFFDNANKQYKKYGALSHGRKYVITIGGGAGYISKTVPYNIYSDREAVQVVSNILEASASRHGHKNDVKRGVSPHTLKTTKYGGRTYQFGQCEMKITENENTL